MIPDFANKRILIAPLDWGIGHATRCVPLIEQLATNNTVYIGVTSSNQQFFSTLFPGLPQCVLPAYNIQYHAHLPAWLKVLLQRRAIQKVIAAEHQTLKHLVKTETFDVIISDNRFGCYHTGVHSIYITHQLSIPLPLIGWLAQRLHHRYLSRFNEIWVPDVEDIAFALGGRLSHPQKPNPIHGNIRYIGPLSRLKKRSPATPACDYLLILSGPEPQQHIFKTLFMQVADRHPHKRFTIIQAGAGTLQGSHNLQIVDGTLPDTLAEWITSAKTIVCRSGYSTLMDLHPFLPLNIILVPTPGQPEQTYLARYWKQQFQCRVVKQQHLLYTRL